MQMNMVRAGGNRFSICSNISIGFHQGMYGHPYFVCSAYLNIDQKRAGSFVYRGYFTGNAKKLDLSVQGYVVPNR